jgi:hypothetical protein
MINLAPSIPPGQPPRAADHTGVALRAVYTQFLQSMEDMFYKKLWENKYKSVTPQQQVMQPAQPQLMQAPNVGAGMSARFLDAVANAPAGQLNDQQRRLLEEARRQSQSAAQTAPNMGNANVPSGNNAIAMQMKMNPSVIIPWVRSREELMKNKCREYSQYLRRFG